MAEPERGPRQAILERAGERAEAGAVVVIGPPGMTVERVVDAVLRKLTGTPAAGDPELYVMASPPEGP